MVPPPPEPEACEFWPMLPVSGAREEEGWRGSSKSLRSAEGEGRIQHVSWSEKSIGGGVWAVQRGREIKYHRRDLSCRRPRGTGSGSRLSWPETPSSLYACVVAATAFARWQHDLPRICKFFEVYSYVGRGSYWGARLLLDREKALAWLRTAYFVEVGN